MELAVAWLASIPILSGAVIQDTSCITQRTPFSAAVGPRAGFLGRILYGKHIVQNLDIPQIGNVLEADRRTERNQLANLQAEPRRQETYVSTMTVGDYVQIWRRILLGPRDERPSRLHPVMMPDSARP